MRLQVGTNGKKSGISNQKFWLIGKRTRSSFENKVKDTLEKAYKYCSFSLLLCAMGIRGFQVPSRQAVLYMYMELVLLNIVITSLI